VIRNLAGLFRRGRPVPRGLPGILAALGILALLAFLSREVRPEGDPALPAGAPEPARLCGRRHPGGGESVRVDLGAVREALGDLEVRWGQALKTKAKEVAVELDAHADAGLPACRGESLRTLHLAEGTLSRLRGRVLLFTEVLDPERLELPREIAENPRAEILILRTRRLGDLPRIAERLGRPVSLGSAELARTLGIRCASTWIRVSEKGDELELHESR
jgi:hypothetical protein